LVTQAAVLLSKAAVKRAAETRFLTGMRHPFDTQILRRALSKLRFGDACSMNVSQQHPLSRPALPG
jgi:hypothetical protein